MPPCRIAFRADASTAIGTGHIRRCVALARALAQAGAEVRFLCRSHDIDYKPLLTQRLVLLSPASLDFKAVADLPRHAAWLGRTVEEDAAEVCLALADWRPEWVIVDHYAIDSSWHKAVREALGSRIAVIDDLADRRLAADVVIDHNWHLDHTEKYAGLLSTGTLVLGGPRYALLGAEYADAPRYVFNETVRSIGIFMGGADERNVSQTALVAIEAAGFEGPVEIATTSANRHLNNLRKVVAARTKTTLTVDLQSLATFFAQHDLQIGAGGGAAWERCCIGVPSLLVATAANQRVPMDALRELGAAKAVQNATGAALSTAITAIVGDPAGRAEMARKAELLVDGRGAQRVAASVLGTVVRPATADDAGLIWIWRNHPAVRSTARDDAEIGWESHKKWFARALAQIEIRLFIGMVGNRPVGVVRFDVVAPFVHEVSIYLDPAMNGLGLGKALLRAGEAALIAGLGSPLTIRAEVLRGNAVSHRLFIASGYQKKSDCYIKQFAKEGANADQHP
jgi:UDP-2,4-diacetamido-2,4,6-trideoxy-beta-L-altropyranose hydrolase